MGSSFIGEVGRKGTWLIFCAKTIGRGLVTFSVKQEARTSDENERADKELHLLNYPENHCNIFFYASLPEFSPVREVKVFRLTKT